MSRASLTSNNKRHTASGGGRSRSPADRLLSKTTSALSLMKSSSSVASLNSLRNGKVTAFNEKINDTFPKTIVKGSMPIISLPKINVERKETNTVSLVKRDVRRFDILSKDKRFYPAADLLHMTDFERAKIVSYLGLTDSYINELVRFELKQSCVDEDEMISVFEKASQRILPRIKSSDGEITDVDGSIQQGNFQGTDFDTFIGVDVRVFTREGSSSSASTRPYVNSRLGSKSSSSSRFPAIDSRFASSTASISSLLGSSSSGLSPTWAMKSFVHLTGDVDAKVNAKGFDWDTLSIDDSVDDSSIGSISTKKTLKSMRTVQRKGSSSSKSNEKSGRKERSNTQKDMSSMSAAELKTELLNSLISMQSHTMMVQDGILHVQDIVSIQKPQAKTVVRIMAAERMRDALGKILLRELGKGFNAWTMDFRSQAREKNLKKANRFLQLRLVAFLLRRWLLNRLFSKFNPWKTKYTEEKQRENNLKKIKAVILLQKIARGLLSRRRVDKLKEVGKYRAMYEATIKIQALFRGRLVFWRYKRAKRKKLEDKSCRLAQRVYRGYKARCRVYVLRLRILKNTSAIMIQCMIRSKIARQKVKSLKEIRRVHRLVIKVQSVVRMYITKKNVASIAETMHKVKVVIKIQKRIRGFLGRKSLDKQRKKMQALRELREMMALNIQRVYRGHRGRTYFKVKAVDHIRKTRKKANASTQITRIVRGFLGRRLLRRMRKMRFSNWVAFAKLWQETWSPEANQWFYVDRESGETLWEPPKGGYTKDDGMLVLESGETIIDPAKSGMSEEEDYNTNRLCSECFDRVAIRKCKECGDKFCTKCYNETHATGTRKFHKAEPIGPIDCSNCELVLAERWCVTCDEAFCDKCWRQVHTNGKRRYHPFSEVDINGKIDPRMFTIDGEEVQGGYDAAYPQKQVDREFDASGGNAPSAFAYTPYSAEVANTEEWSQYYDAEGNAYWYNNYTQVSQYESPYG